MSPAAEELKFQARTAVERYVGDQQASPEYVEIRFATDESAGQYPQAALVKGKTYFKNDDDLYRDRFPEAAHEPVQLKLRRGAKWTDVLSSDLWDEGSLVSATALSVFTKFPLGKAKQYRAEVQGGKVLRECTYLFIANHVGLEDLDFRQSEFYVANMIGDPQRPHSVSSATDFETQRERIVLGELEGIPRFSRLSCKRLQFLPGRAPAAAYFGLGTLSTQMYIRRNLYLALREAEITGLEFKRNNLLIDPT